MTSYQNYDIIVKTMISQYDITAYDIIVGVVISPVICDIMFCTVVS